MYYTRTRLPTCGQPPRERVGLLARPRLTGALVRAALNRRITLVTAPSGFGKTTLLADTYRRLPALQVAQIWLSVTDADRDLVWLGRMLIDQLAEYYKASPLPGESFADFVSRLGDGHQVIVMIDNWNFIESDATNNYFDRLVEETEGLANFVVSSRTDPGFLFETYSMTDEFASFGMRELAFTHDEAHEFLVDCAPPQSEDVLQALIERTEGWAAGIQLLRLALNQVGAGGARSIHFSGSRTDVANYLNKTLFNRLSARLRALLCSLAVLDEVNGELAQAITGNPLAETEFAALNRDDIFLTETSEGSQRFRFHSLVRDFLLSQSHITLDLPQPDILRLAGEWHAARGEHEVAIPYIIRAGEHLLAQNLLHEYVRRHLLADGKIYKFTEWVREYVGTGGELSQVLEHWYRWSLVFTGRWNVARECLQPELSHREVMIEAVICAFSDDQNGLHAAVARWVADGAQGDSFSLAVMRCAAALADIASGNLNSATQHLYRAKFLVERTVSGFGRAWVLAISALVSLMKGQVKKADEDIREALKTTDRMTGPRAPIARLTRLLAAVIAYHRGDAEMAAGDFAFAPDSADEHGLPFIVVWAASVAGALAPEAASWHLDTRLHSPAALLIGEAYRIESKLREGCDPVRLECLMEEFEAQLAAARDHDPTLFAHSWNLLELHTCLLVRAAMLRGEHEAAQHLLMPALSASQRDGRGLAEQKFSMLKIAVLLRQNKKPAALRLLIQTAETAVRNGLFRFILDEHRTIEPLLPALFEAGERTPLGNDAQLWRQFTKMLGQCPRPASNLLVQGGELNESLQVTSRESEMLGLLELGLSNRQIGDRLGIAVPTVKWHLNNLFSKIGVTNRCSAVHFARDSGLI